VTKKEYENHKRKHEVWSAQGRPANNKAEPGGSTAVSFFRIDTKNNKRKRK